VVALPDLEPSLWWFGAGKYYVPAALSRNVLLLSTLNEILLQE
jgi:hypothetical protein